MNRRAIAAIGLAALVVVGFVLLAVGDRRLDGTPFKWRDSAVGRMLLGRSSSPQSPVARGARANEAALLYEIRNASDVRAAYEKYKSMDDPTGAVPYALRRAMGDCGGFMDPAWYANLRSRTAPGDKPRRDALLERSLQRCKGFSGWDQQMVYEAANVLYQRAIDARYPPALAEDLSIRFTDADREELAKQLLSSSEIDGDVINGVYAYLMRLNGRGWRLDPGEAATRNAAWMLLACNYGADCGENNTYVTNTCLYIAVCEPDVQSVLPATDPFLTPERMAEAARRVPILDAHIRSRDWSALGF